MRRAGIIATLSLTLVALVAGAVDAKPVTSFRARANHGEQGGALHIQAKVKHPTRGSTFSATAVVHFASGDVSVELSRRGKSFVAGGRAPIAADEAPGPVAVDVMITYNGVTQTVATQGVVHASDEEADDDGEEDPDV